MSSIEITSGRIFHFVRTALKRAAHRRESFGEGRRGCTGFPGAGEFRSVLANEFAWAVESKRDLAVLYVGAPECSRERQEKIGSMLRKVTGKLGDVFLYSPECFAVLISRSDSAAAARLSLEVLSLLRGSFPDGRLRINLAAYPQIVERLDGFEALAPGCPLPPAHGATGGAAKSAA